MLRSGSICISFLYKYLTSENNTENTGDELIKRGTKLKCLTDTFQSYGGVLSKLSQILSVEDQNSNVFSDCKPFSQKKTIEYLKNEFETNDIFFKDIEELDFNVYKSGSVGQVHKALYNKNGKSHEIVLKVQYVGLYEQVQTDLFILDKLTSYLFHFSDLSHAMIDIKTKLYEELDYKTELNNQQTIFKLWENHPNIKIPEVIPELSTDKILGMYYINADSLNTFILNSTQDERNNIGNYIVEFIFTNMYNNKIFYSDIHYGNFLIQDNKKLYVMDFGCINSINDELLENIKNLHISILDKNIDNFYNIVEKMGIINCETISEKSKNYIYYYFNLQFTPLISEEFQFTEEWLTKSVYKETELMKEWQLPPNMVYLNKIPYGLYHILTKLNLKCNFTPFFNKLLKL